MDDFDDDAIIPVKYRESNYCYYDTLKSFLKLLVILTCYAAVFVSLVHFGFWVYQTRQIDSDGITIWELLVVGKSHGQWEVSLVTKYLLMDFALLLLFGLQHTCMASRNLVMSKYWEIVHYVWEIDKAIYNLMTALALQIVITFWQPVGISLWKMDDVHDFHFVFHIIAWAGFYGTNLMIDLPDLIGLNQVMIECPNKIAKSPEFKAMMENQRHMGLIPLAAVLFIHPCMSLDRLLLAIGILTYACGSWRSQSCYPYAKSMKKVKRYAVYNHEG